MEHAVTGVLFLKFPDLHFHLEHVLDFVYIAGSCRFRFYFFFHRDFAVPLTHPMFDPSAPYITIPLYLEHPFPPPTVVAAPTALLMSPLEQVPSISLDDDDGDDDPSEATSSSSSSSTSSDGYAPVDANMANGFLSLESI